MTSGMCAHKDSNQPVHLKSDHNLHCQHEETLHPWLSKMCSMKILIRHYMSESTSSDIAAYMLCFESLEVLPEVLFFISSDS